MNKTLIACIYFIIIHNFPIVGWCTFFMKKLFYISNSIFAILLPLVSINLIINKSNPDHFFPIIFMCLGLCNTAIGINLLNSNKKILSVSSFILAGFLFILVGSKVYLNNYS